MVASFSSRHKSMVFLVFDHLQPFKVAPGWPMAKGVNRFRNNER